MSDQTRLLWHSNSPLTATGYGSQTALFLKHLKPFYNVACSAFWGSEGHIASWEGVPILPGIGNTHGNETILEHAKVFFGDDPRVGITFTLLDVWVLDPQIWSQLNPLCSWVPIDHEPCPLPIHDYFTQSGAIPIAMSRFGEKQLEDLNPLYVPHAVDTEIYRPIPKREAREATGMQEDAFIVGMVAANKGNPSRKCFQEACEAFKHFQARHNDALLYLHTEVTGRFDGVDLIALAKACDIPEKSLVICDQYRAIHFPFPAETMAHVYSSLDVLLAPSAGEGFGIPAIEAQSCGVPVIVSDFSAQPELVGAGWLVEGTKSYTALRSWQFRPDVGDILEALNHAYGSRGVEAYAKRARAKAEEYDIKTVLSEYMLPALQTVADRIEEKGEIKVKAA